MQNTRLNQIGLEWVNKKSVKDISTLVEEYISLIPPEDVQVHFGKTSFVADDVSIIATALVSQYLNLWMAENSEKYLKQGVIEFLDNYARRHYGLAYATIFLAGTVSEKRMSKQEHREVAEYIRDERILPVKNPEEV